MRSLRQRIQASGLSRSQLGNAVHISKQQVSDIVNHNKWPRSRDQRELRQSIEQALAAAEVKQHAGDVSPAAGRAAAVPANPVAKPDQQGTEMLLRKQPLSTEAKKKFGVFANPWNGEVTSDDEMFVTNDMRYVREAMWHAARNAGLMAVIGESGSGKTTIKETMLDRIERETKPIVAIQPSVLGLEDNDVKGKSMKAGSIADAIIWSIDPRAKPPGSMEAKSRLLHTVLSESQKAGQSHVLIIEEAHCLALPTLKHLKRFHELKASRRRLLGILLIGQPELRLKLAESNHEVREFVQRCEIATLDPLDSSLREYLAFRAKRAERQLNDFIDESGVEALRGRLSIGRPGEKGFRSLLYPLAVNNMMTAAMNHAAELGAPRINADIVRGI